MMIYNSTITQMVIIREIANNKVDKTVGKLTLGRWLG